MLYNVKPKCANIIHTTITTYRMLFIPNTSLNWILRNTFDGNIVTATACSVYYIIYIYIMMVFTIHRFFSRWYYADDTKSIAVNRKWKWKKKHNSLKMVTNEEKKWIKTNKFALFCVAIHNANIIESVLVVWYGMVCYFTLNRIQWQTKCERIYKIVL